MANHGHLSRISEGAWSLWPEHLNGLWRHSTVTSYCTGAAMHSDSRASSLRPTSSLHLNSNRTSSLARHGYLLVHLYSMAHWIVPPQIIRVAFASIVVAESSDSGECIIDK